MPVSDDSSYVIMGRVNGLFGVRGWLKIYSYTRPKENIFSYKALMFEQAGDWKPVQTLEWKKQGKGLVALFEGIDDRTAAQAFMDVNIGVARKSLPPLPENEYYWCDLIGLEVINQENTALGEVVGVQETGANDVLNVQGKKKYLIPLLKGSVVKKVDLERGQMLVDWTGEYI